MEIISTPRDSTYNPWQWKSLAAAFDSLDRTGRTLDDATAQQGVSGLEEFLQFAAKTAADRAAPVETRAMAVRVLGRRHSDRDADLPMLKVMLQPDEHPEVSRAALASIAARGDVPAAEAILEILPQLSPSLRDAALDVLLAREASAMLLLECVSNGAIAASALDATRRAQLLDHPAAKVKALAESVLNASPPLDRRVAIQQALAVTLHTGDAARGRVVFEAKCAGCHQVQGVGHKVGPDLAALTERSVPAFLAAMFDPNRAVDARFVTYSALTKDGLTLTGILAAESGTDLKLLAQDGKQHVILRTDLDVLQASHKSLMPEGLEKELTAPQVADLFAWLGVAQPAPKIAEGCHPETIQPGADGALQLSAAQCEVYGPTLLFMPEDNALGYWNSTDDYCAWTIDVPAAGDYEVSMEWSCDETCADNGFAIESRTGQLTGKVPSTKTWQNHQQQSCGTLSLEQGKQRVLFRADGPLKEALLDLRWVKLTPVEE